MIRDAVSVPVIAAGCNADGRSMLPAYSLGADGVQVGSRFAATVESSAHELFKQAILNAAEGDTKLSMKSVVPVRLLNNDFFQKVAEAEGRGADRTELLELLGRGRAKKGMYEGDLVEGELEIGQVSALIKEIEPAAQVLTEIWQGFLKVKEKIRRLEI